MFYTVCYSIKNIKSVAENKDTKDKKKKTSYNSTTGLKSYLNMDKRSD